MILTNLGRLFLVVIYRHKLCSFSNLDILFLFKRLLNSPQQKLKDRDRMRQISSQSNKNIYARNKTQKLDLQKMH